MFDYVFMDGSRSMRDDSGILSKNIPNARDIALIAPLFWSDHCLECSAPLCYASCTMFEANHFGKCKRMAFIEERTGVDAPFSAIGMKYKKWAKLRCAYNNSLAYSGTDFAREHLSQHRKYSLTSKIDKRLEFLKPSLRYPFSRWAHHRYIKRFHVTRGGGSRVQ